MNENSTQQDNSLGTKIYNDIKIALHRFIVVILAIGVIVPLAYMTKGYVISLLSIAIYAVYHLTFFRFAKPRF